MKRHELKSLIQECVHSLINENFLTEQTNDPTKEEMLQFLRQQFGNEAGMEDDAEVAMYWFANHYHGGQGSNLYSVLSTSRFSPGPIARGPQPDSMEMDMYQALESQYADKGHQHQGQETETPPDSEDYSLEEDGAAAGGQGGPGAPGTGMGNVTANVDPIRTPKAFKHPKNLPAHRLEEKDEEWDEKKNPLYVEYHSERQGEEPFMMHDQKYQYVNAKYPDGKIDIGVYVFGQDLVVSYDTFRKWYNINESEMTDQSTGEVVPGPRDRFDMQKGGGGEPKFITHYTVSGLEQIPDSKHPSKVEALKAAAEFLKRYVTSKSKAAGEKLVKLDNGYAIKHIGGGTVAIATIEPLKKTNPLVPMNEAVPNRILKLKDLLKKKNKKS